MNAPTDFDIGPLTWVKSEIDLALERGAKALQDFMTSAVDAPGDLTHIRFCRTHLHQVQGALTIVGLDGVTQFAEATEALLSAIERGERPASESSLTLARRALTALGNYLADLMSGRPNQPLRLLPLYREVQQARGQERVLPSDLFFPDLRVRPPRRASTVKINRNETHRHLHKERARFQRGLLAWLRDPRHSTGAMEMREAVKRIEELQELPATRSFWWVATAFLSALADRTLLADTDAKQLCSRIDLQIRRLLEGSSNVAERLMRDALYLVGNAKSNERIVRRVQEVYNLAALLPDANTEPPKALDAVRRRLRESIAATEEAWTKFCGGTVQALPAFWTSASALFATANELGDPDLLRLTKSIANVAGLLATQPTSHTDALAMETATAILLAQHALENLPRLGDGFSRQVGVMVGRIADCITGKPLRPESELPALDEMSRQAQERLLNGQVAREIQNNLGQIEQILDGFFRDADKRTELNGLSGILRQIIGALTIMRHDGAVTMLRQCATEIEKFAKPDYVPQETDFERVAEQLALVGFFVDALRNGTADFASFVNEMRHGNPPPAFDDETPASVEQEIEQGKLETHALLAALKEQPDDASLRQEVRQNLAALQKDADLIADSTLGQKAQEVLSALTTGDDAARQIDDAMATLKPQASAAPPPSAATIQLSQASSEELDAEILGIFLDEAEEVLARIDGSYRTLQTQPHDLETLTALRRSIHTLKGSGRMVGLKDLGEAAWAIEQVLNLWLRQEQPATPALLELIGRSYAIFVVWIGQLRTGIGQIPDACPLIAAADALRLGSETPVESLLASTPPPPAPSVLPTNRANPTEEATVFPSANESLSSAVAPGEAETATATPAHRPRLSITPALTEIFNDEARTHLATLQREFASLELEPAAPTKHEMYRAAHTLAGIAGTVGIASVNLLARALEHALVRRNQTLHPGDLGALAVIQQTVDALTVMLADTAIGDEPDTMPALVAALATLYPPSVAEQPVAIAHREANTPPPTIEKITETAAPPPAPATPTPPLYDELDEQLLPLFLEEALDLNQNIATQMQAWRDDPADGEPPRRLARLFHTLKGSARMSGAMTIGDMVHAVETRLQDARQAEDLSPELVEDIDAAFDAIVQCVDALQKGDAPGIPPEPVAQVTDSHSQPRETDTGQKAVAAPADAIAKPPESPESDGDAALQRATLRVRADLIDRLVNETGELAIARSRIEGEMRAIKSSLLDLTENVIRLRRQLREVEMQAELQMESRTVQTNETQADFDPLEFDRFTHFQELTRMMAESVNDVAAVQQNLLKNLDDANAALVAQSRLNRDVQQELMSIRMVPFGSIADRLYRIVRQAAKEVGKRANLEIGGAQLELDRSVLDKMLAPLEHMLRNAVAHGLEDTSTRVAKGKPAIGEISLNLTQEGNEIILTLADDGAGIDLDRLRERGLAAGLLTAAQAADQERVIELIFAQGISTAKKVSRLSGRGIGMDVLKSEVASLGGRIEVLTAAGQGTTFRLYLPLTLAMTKALLVRVGGKQFAIPAAMIEQVLDLKEKGLRRIRDANSATWNGNHYPFHYLPHLLGDPRTLPEKRRQYWVLLLRSGSRRIALQIDELLGNQEIVVKNIGQQLARVIGIDGATVLGNGQVVLILNPVALTGRDHGGTAIAPVPTERKSATSERGMATVPTVMVVDDSLTVRKITSRLLAREGYAVLTAKDGVDALEQMFSTHPDVLLLDIEMPRMDGFELTRNLRAEPRLRDIPIIMITSRTATKHREYARELGVNNYLGKPYQEDELLGLIAGHLAQRAASRLTTA
ncbi:MAG TPA: Hpt domain-containing protein [Accumulibacter sp.]|jgi:chemosensory pili system protein ChpA (sensor histidine kinase/response regulator)|nr:Hpt domain-containing protein [Accumulibacter sp.]